MYKLKCIEMSLQGMMVMINGIEAFILGWLCLVVVILKSIKENNQPSAEE